MLDRDPNADQPPEPSLSRPRSRSRKPKNAPKKHPQRGLGVAQLEKLRLEEQSKQQEAACLASLQQQNLHHQSHYIHFQQKNQQAPYLHYQHQKFLQPHHQSQNSPHCLPRQIKHVEPSYEKFSFAEPHFPLPPVQLNVVQNSLFPLATLANRGQTRTLPLLLPLHQLPADDEPSTSPMSQVHDLCSPATTHLRPSSAESRLSPLLTCASSASLVEKSWLNHLYDREPNIEKDSSSTDLSSARCDENGSKMQSQDQSVPNCGNAAIANFHGETGSLHLSMGKLFMQSDGCSAPITDSCLRSQPDRVFDVHSSPRTQLESPPVAIVSVGIQMKELSSFQNMSLCPTWCPVDKVVNRKRSWACTQELSRQAEAFIGVDLNTSFDEMESELTEQDPNITLPFTIRNDWNFSSGNSSEKFNESRCKGLVSDKSCSQCDFTKVDRPFSDACASAAAFLSLHKQSINPAAREVEAPGDFLTLGPSSSSIRNIPFRSGGCGNHPVSRSSASPWYSQQIILEQVRSSCLSSASKTVNSDAMPLQPSFVHTPLQRKVGFSDFFACDKMEALLQDSSTDESLDLELRLSI
ncbi:hypothetical protein GOP47_0020252 [Adiantum capillus-veneris]|uniref:Uncharacterized protein n=1 Tax=Adiantum capillus-veneris TaxID=13818 RepID=A0A9D4Z9D5_ADICA|nr:hypothetical protein GOP47_0019590 [Adiantum capillus-veneris]KAI5065557.1 hypothetical protein GOP47_0020252 [Adiantum capillus-veneris]